MRKLTILASGVAVALAAGTARAQSSNNGLAVWYDVRSTVASIITTPVAPFTKGTSVLANVKKAANKVPNITPDAVGPGQAGDAAILFISPELPCNAANALPAQWVGSVKKGFVNHGIKNLYKYITVGNREAALDEVIGALGLDIDIIKGGLPAEGARLEALTYTANAALWDGESSTVTDNLPLGVAGINFTIGTKAVRVPVAAGPVFDPTGAIPGIHQVATIIVNAADWDKVAAVPADNTYRVRDRVNNLLVTRVYNGAPAPANAIEQPDFGYVMTPSDAIGPPGAVDNFVTATNEEVAGANGNTVGATSVQFDAMILVIPKGDYSNDNVVTAADIQGFNDATIAQGAGLIRQREAYLGDFTNEGQVTAGDIAGFNSHTLALGGVCPCVESGVCP